MMPDFDNPMDRGAMELDADSGHSDTPTQETRKSSRMFRKQQRFNSIDSLFENSVSSAGEFFSKAIATSFGNNNGNSNYCYSASEAICGTNAYNEDQMDFGELGRKKSNDYVDWDPRLKPKYGVMNEKPRRPVRTLDFSKYKLYDFVGNDSGSTDLSSKSQESPWYNSHDEGSYGGQRNTTWDGRAWPIEKPSQPRPRRSESTDAYTDMPDCRICPNNNNSSASLSCFGNMNNNYPNYEIYETQSDNTPRRDPQLQRPVSSDNDYAPYMYGNPSQERQRPRQETPRRVTQTQGGYMDAGGSPYFGLNTCSSSMADYADYADSPPPEQLRVVREPSPPRPPKVIKVGSILVRNNVENNDDYAENVNRDLGEDSSSFGGMAFNQEMNHQGKAFAYQTSQSLVSEPANLRQIMDVQNALERERSVPKPQSKPLRRERSLQRDSLKPTVHNNDTSKKSYSNNKYDDGEDRKSWAQERKSLTDVRKTSQESRKTTRDVQKSYKPNNKPKRSASMGGRESTYVQHRPSAGGDHMRSAKPHQTREERSYRKERPQNVYSKKDDKKKEEEKKGRSYGSWLNPLNLFRGK